MRETPMNGYSNDPSEMQVTQTQPSMKPGGIAPTVEIRKGGINGIKIDEQPVSVYKVHDLIKSDGPMPADSSLLNMLQQHKANK